MNLLKTALAAVVLVAAAESRAANRWGLGPLAGVNLSGADLGGPEDRGIMGWAIGGRVDYGMNRLLSLSTDPMFTRTGAEWDPVGESFEARGQFYRVEVPMFLKARMDIFNLGVYAFAGPNATFLWGASGQLDEANTIDPSETSWGGVSGDIGIGSAFAVAPLVDVTADARYSHGLTDMLETGAGEVNHWQNRDVRVVLGVLLHGG
jgi:hypothetical protein